MIGSVHGDNAHGTSADIVDENRNVQGNVVDGDRVVVCREDRSCGGYVAHLKLFDLGGRRLGAFGAFGWILGIAICWRGNSRRPIG